MNDWISVEHIYRPGEIRDVHCYALKSAIFYMAPGMLFRIEEGSIASVPRWLVEKLVTEGFVFLSSDKERLKTAQILFKKKMENFELWKCHECPRGFEKEGRWRFHGSEFKYCSRCHARLKMADRNEKRKLVSTEIKVKGKIDSKVDDMPVTGANVYREISPPT